MRPLVAKIKPATGFAHFFYLGLLVLLPAIVFVLVSLGFFQLALSIVVLSKWRMFAVRPRFWPANIRANAVDLLVGIPMVLFMYHSGSEIFKLLWAVLYAVWLIYIKPKSSLFMVSLQAFIGQFTGLMALYLVWGSGPLYGLTIITGLICYLSARHFFESFDEPYNRLLSYVWAYFGAALAWLLGHWLLFYGLIAQITLLLSTLGYGMAALYYLDHNDRLGKATRRQFIFIMLAIVLLVLTFSDWGDKVVG
jgi:hypothetical protein